MKILVYEQDIAFARRLEYYLHEYASEMQVYAFDALDKLRNYMEHEEFDVVLCAPSEEISDWKSLDLPLGQVPFAWWTNKNERIDDNAAIYKYQSIPKLYDQICSLYESVYQHSLVRETKERAFTKEIRDAQIITFFPVHGGAGSSVMAIACAKSFSADARVLYLNLEQFAGKGYFHSDNEKTFSDIISEARGKYTKESLQKTMALAMGHDAEVNAQRLSLIAGCKNAADITSISGSTMREILTLLKQSGQYDYIVLDADMIVSDLTQTLILQSDKLVLTTDASDLANQKLKKVQRYLQIVQRSTEETPAEQYLIYNKFYADADLSDYTKGMVVIGKFGRYRLQENRQISLQTIVQNICRTPQLFQRLR